MNIIHFRNKLNERIQKIVCSPDFEPYHLEDAEVWMTTGRGLSGPVSDLIELNSHDILVDTGKFESDKMDELYDRLKLFERNMIQLNAREEGIIVLLEALDELGHAPMVNIFKRLI